MEISHEWKRALFLEIRIKIQSEKHIGARSPLELNMCRGQKASKPRDSHIYTVEV
jgi:hypothetical protein